MSKADWDSYFICFFGCFVLPFIFRIFYGLLRVLGYVLNVFQSKIDRAELNRTAARWPKSRTELYRLLRVFQMLLGVFF